MNQNRPRQVSIFTRISYALFGEPKPKKLTKLDVRVLNGYLYIGEYQVEPGDASDIALEIIRRLRNRI